MCWEVLFFSLTCSLWTCFAICNYIQYVTFSDVVSNFAHPTAHHRKVHGAHQLQKLLMCCKGMIALKP